MITFRLCGGVIERRFYYIAVFLGKIPCGFSFVSSNVQSKNTLRSSVPVFMQIVKGNSTSENLVLTALDVQCSALVVLYILCVLITVL